MEKPSRNLKNTQSSSKDGLMFYSRIYSSDSDCEKWINNHYRPRLDIQLYLIAELWGKHRINYFKNEL